MEKSDLEVKFFGDTFSGNVYDFKMVRFLTDAILDVFHQLLAVHLGTKRLPSEVRDTITHDVSIQNGVMTLSINCEKQLLEQFGIAADGALYSEDLSERLSDSLAKLFYTSLQLREYIAKMTGGNASANIVIDTEADELSPSVIKTEKGNIVLKDPKTLWAAKMTRKSADSVFDLVHKGVLSSMKVEGLSRPLYFDREQDRLVRTDSQKDDISATARFTGRINNLFFSSKAGTVVSDDNVYPITWNESTKAKVMEYADVADVEFLVQPCISENEIHANVTTYEIIDCQYKGEAALAG